MTARPTLPIPLVALEERGAILGVPGAGKSGTGRLFLEHELDLGHRCCVLDPKGDWWGIRADKAGKPSRFEIPVFGGSHADVEIRADMGASLGRIVASSASSSVIDVSGFDEADMLDFMEGFARELFTVNRQPLTLLVDEADQFAPESATREQRRVLRWMDKLMRQGRQRGIIMWLLTQRQAAISKSLLNMATTMIAMRATAPAERDVVKKWMAAHSVERGREVEAGLAGLRVGEAFAWVESAHFLERVQFPLYETYDSGRTPRHGEQVGDVALKPLDVAEIAKVLGGDETPAQDEAARLRETLAQERQLAKQLRAEIDAAEARADDAERRADRLLATLTDVQDRIGAAFGSARIDPLPKGAAFEDYLMLEDHDGVVRPFPRAGDPHVRMDAARRRLQRVEAPPTNEDLRAAIASAAENMPAVAHMVPARRRIAAAAASAGGEFIDLERIALLAGVSPRSSHMVTGVRRLAEEGLLRIDGHSVAATPAAMPQTSEQPAASANARKGVR